MKKKFDYIIIGAGSAGCVLANRLSANEKHSVLLVEAGGKDKQQNIKIPAAFPKLYKSEVDYNYHTIPQTTGWPQLETLRVGWGQRHLGRGWVPGPFGSGLPGRPPGAVVCSVRAPARERHAFGSGAGSRSVMVQSLGADDCVINVQSPACSQS